MSIKDSRFEKANLLDDLNRMSEEEQANEARETKTNAQLMREQWQKEQEKGENRNSDFRDPEILTLKDHGKKQENILNNMGNVDMDDWILKKQDEENDDDFSPR